MDFERRLEQAIDRGARARAARARDQAAAALSSEELRHLYTQYRLELTEHIERTLGTLPSYLPGFRYESVVSDRGWGAAVSRDDLAVGAAGSRASLFSRLEIFVRPPATYQVLELAAKGTVRNKEIYQRQQFQKLDEADIEVFRQFVDQWIVEYAELYSAEA